MTQRKAEEEVDQVGARLKISVMRISQKAGGLLCSNKEDTRVPVEAPAAVDTEGQKNHTPSCQPKNSC